jgi:DNA-binding XRE family transcriptional regulator
MQKATDSLQTVEKTGNIMEKKKREKLEEKGFRVGSAADFLELTPEEEAYIDIRLDISNLVKAQRAKRDWTQEQLARAIGSSQSRIAKLEGGDPGISLDLMIKALLRLGTSKKQIGKLLEGELEPA